MSTSNTVDATARLSALEADTRRELEQTRGQLNEIQLLVQQSEGEAERLAQRETTIASRVRDMELNLENYTRNDIKTLYTTSHEVSMRLFIMRSQVEQLQLRYEQARERQQMLGQMLSLVGSLDGVIPDAALQALDKPKPGNVDMVADLRRVIEAQESERLRVSRYLHDGPAQKLTNLVLKAEICEHLIDRDTAEAKAELKSLRSTLTDSLQETRRLIFSLRPMSLDDIGLVPTLRRYLTEAGRSAGFTPTVRGPEGNDGVSPLARAIVFRLVQDIVTELSERTRLEQVSINMDIAGDAMALSIDARAAADAPPPLMEEVLALEPVHQRLYMLNATPEVTLVGDRGVQVTLEARLPQE